LSGGRRIPGAPGDGAQGARRERLRWYLDRLRCMGPAEVASRAAGAAAARLRARGVFTAARVRQPALRAVAPWLAPDPALVAHADAYREHASRVLEGPIEVLGVAVDLRPQHVRWNLDPLTGTEAPLVHGESPRLRDPALVGDLKQLWEPNRHHHLVWLAQAWRLCGEMRFGDGLLAALGSWLEQCPYPRGPNWSSALELGVRLINWAACWQLVGGAGSALFAGPRGGTLRARWLEAVYRHVHFIESHPSRFSSANNHRIGELASLVVAASTWPFWPRTERLLRPALDALCHEVLAQNGPDGVNREQAFGYQIFVLELILTAQRAAEAAGTGLPAPGLARVEAMLEFVASVVDTAGNLPRHGDGDDARVLDLDPASGAPVWHSLLADGAVRFERADLARKAGGLPIALRWLRGPGVESDFRASQHGREGPLPVRRAFPEGGYYLLGHDFEGPGEVRVLADCGPLGHLAIAAHGHADALSLQLWAGGRPLLVDAGTFRYHAGARWRDHFRSTAAHNTLRVDGAEQSEMAGPFLWLHKARAWCEAWQPGEQVDRWQGAHDGYRRLRDPVLHRRRLELHHGERLLRVEDRLQCRSAHRVERFWHFSADCRVWREAGEIRARSGECSLRLRPGGAALRILHGDEESPGGWVSPCYGRRMPATTLVVDDEIHGDTTLVTELWIA